MPIEKRTEFSRLRIVRIFVILVFLIYWVRLFQIQILTDDYKTSSQNNALRYKVQYPGRGLIYDRNNKLMVYNESVYDLMIIPSLAKNTNWKLLSSLIDISEEEAIEKYNAARRYSRHAPSLFEKQISKETYGKLQEYLYQLDGFYVRPRSLRSYPHKSAAHVLGDVGEISESELAAMPNYKQGDYIGKSGLEKYYEDILKGHKGVKIELVDVLNREKGSYKNGEFDSLPIDGENLYTSLDIELQLYAEKLMKNRRGSVVAIEPKTGEILVLVSSPTYDPNLLVGRRRSNNYSKLLNDPSKPLFDRALMAAYPPGSIFKIPQALIAMNEGLITPHTFFSCDKHLIGCHAHPSAASVSEALKMSCNPYFYNVFKRLLMRGESSNRFIDSRLGLQLWKDAILRFGFNQRLGIDLPNVKSGFIPDSNFYDRVYGNKQWAFSTIYSLSIGQGEIGLIPLQMANLAAIVANRGYFYTPHIVKYVGEEKRQLRQDSTKHSSNITQDLYNYVVDGMYKAVHEAGGTARRAQIPHIELCGKTGTSQNPHGKDHAVFIGFAPKDDPKIAISVFVENAGFGGTWAAPIASLIVEKYISDTISRPYLEKQMLEQ